MQKIQSIIDSALEKHNNLLKPTLDQVFDEVISNPALCRELFGDVFRGHLDKLIRQRYSQQRDSIINAPNSAICGDPGELDDSPEPPNQPLPVAETSGHAPPAPARAPSQPSKLYLNGLGIAYQKSLLDFTLSDGMKLRVAVRADIEKQYLIYRGQAATGVLRAMWLRRILNALPNDTQQVGAVLNDYALKNHLNMAKKEFDAGFPKFIRLESPHANG